MKQPNLSVILPVHEWLPDGIRSFIVAGFAARLHYLRRRQYGQHQGIDPRA
jgi:hypothetical protein